MKRKTVALYNPFLDTLGGGEKHILSILKVLDEADYEVTIFWNNDLQKEITRKFSLQYINKLRFHPNVFVDSEKKKKINWLSKLKILRQFDLFFYVTDGSYFFSSAKRNYIFCMVPQRNLYNMNLINRLKTLNASFICNSHYTQSWLKRWQIPSQVIYPFISPEFINLSPKQLKQDSLILSVGRFFNQLHSKQHTKIINTFNKLKHANHLYKEFTLILAGGFKKEDIQYINDLRQLIGNRTDIKLIINPPFKELFSWYQRAQYYWHFSGYGINEKQAPQAVEHLGITPLEAMASGCLTFCYNAGGPKEIIENGKNGFLFNNDDELIDQMLKITNPVLIKQQAKTFVTNYFSYSVFKDRVTQIINLQ